MTSPAVFCSTFMYAYAKVVGAAHWPACLQWELAHLDESTWPGFRTLGQCARIGTCRVSVDASTLITKARSRTAGLFLQSDADVWLTVDDDVYAQADVVRRLVDAARSTRGMVAAPYAHRDGGRMTFDRAWGPTVQLAPDVALWNVDHCGMGLVALHRDLVEDLASRAPLWCDDAGNAWPGLFLERIEGERWWGEDYTFCDLVRASKSTARFLLEAPVTHAGHTAKLDANGHMLVQAAPLGDHACSSQNTVEGE